MKGIEGSSRSLNLALVEGQLSLLAESSAGNETLNHRVVLVLRGRGSSSTAGKVLPSRSNPTPNGEGEYCRQHGSLLRNKVDIDLSSTRLTIDSTEEADWVRFAFEEQNCWEFVCSEYYTGSLKAHTDPLEYFSHVLNTELPGRCSSIYMERQICPICSLSSTALE